MVDSPDGGALTGVERRGGGGWESVLGNEAYRVAPGGEWRSELWRVAVTQFNQAADLLGLDADARARLGCSTPLRWGRPRAASATHRAYRLESVRRWLSG